MSEHTLMRRCTKCTNEFDLSMFCRDLSRKDGLHPWCRDCHKKRHAKYYADNSDSVLARITTYRDANREMIRANNRMYRSNHLTEYNAMSRRYYRNNKQKVLDHISNRRRLIPGYWQGWRMRRVRMANIPGVHSAKDIKLQFEKQQGRCFWCDHDITQKYHRDHYIPLSKGGSNDASNIVLACPTCNLRKFNLMPDEFLTRLEDEKF